jgi:hypothetical protein
MRQCVNLSCHQGAIRYFFWLSPSSRPLDLSTTSPSPQRWIHASTNHNSSNLGKMLAAFAYFAFYVVMLT